MIHVRDDLLERLRGRQLLHGAEHRIAPAVAAAGRIDEKVVDEHRLRLGRVAPELADGLTAGLGREQVVARRFRALRQHLVERALRLGERVLLCVRGAGEEQLLRVARDIALPERLEFLRREHAEIYTLSHIVLLFTPPAGSCAAR